MMKLFSNTSLLTRIIGIGLVVTVSFLFVFMPRVTHGEWLLAAFVIVLAIMDPFLGGALLSIDAFSCAINVLWGGCDSGPPPAAGGGGPSADLKVNTDAQQVRDGQTQLVLASPTDVDGPLTVTVPNTSYIIKWSSAQTNDCNFTADATTTPSVGKRGNVSVTDATIGTHNYSIDCNGATDRLVVNVVGPLVNLTGVTPIEMPDPLVLNWTSSNVTSCTAAGQWSGSKALMSPASGETVFASTDGRRGEHTFIMNCVDALGNAASSLKTITVLKVPRCTFGSNPSAIVPPQASTLSWSCQYANSCSIDNGIGSVNRSSGTRRVTPRESTTYSLTCQGDDGPRTFTTAVGVTANPRLHEVNP